jgi:predicted  nucleic acid-binding Zn-ribbon protein
MLAWIPIAAVLAQAPAAQPADLEDVPPELQQLNAQVQQLQQQVDAQRQQIDQLSQAQQTQQESVAGLQNYQDTQVQQLQQREDDRGGRVDLINQAVESILVLQDDLQRGSSDIDANVLDALARVDAAAENARGWGMNREASLLLSSRNQLSSLQAYVAQRNYWEAKIAAYTALREALGAASLMKDVSSPPEPQP